MIFRNNELESLFDLHQHYTNLTINDLVEDILVMNQLLLSYKENNIPIYLINGKPVHLEYVDEATWFRSYNDIKELLYRSNIHKFSIAGKLYQMGIEMTLDYSHLQLLYLFYMLDYYIYPREHIFVSLLSHQYNDNQESLHYDLFDIICHHQQYLHYYIDLSHHASLFFDAIYHEYDTYDAIAIPDNSIMQLLAYLYRQSIYAYCMLFLAELPSLHALKPLSIQPYNSWKRRYIDDIEAFLKENETICFIRQEQKIYTSREKIKFYNSKPVRFVLDLLDYDLDWIGKDHLYALKLAISIKVFYDLTKNAYKFNKHALSRLLNIREQSYDFSAPLYIHFFIILCHREYLHAIGKDEEIDALLHKESTFLSTIARAMKET